MSKKTYYSIAAALHTAGYFLAFLGGTALIFVICCLDSEGAEAMAFLVRVTAAGSLLTAVGALMLRISNAMKERRHPYASRSSRY